MIRNILESRFKKLYQDSTLALCVSEGMRQALGTHANAKLLFPIPEKSAFGQLPEASNKRENFTVIYAGVLSDIYGPMLQQLCTLSQGITEFNIKLFGPQPDWQESLIKEINQEEIYGGFITRDLLINELIKADALLVVMSFAAKDKTRMQTSFPSKLVEYCQFGKPIIIWGPEYCSAVRWAWEYQAALVVTSLLTQDLVKAIQELSTQPELQRTLGYKALEMAHSLFNSDKVQQQFFESIEKTIAFK